MFTFFRSRRRRKLLAEPFPPWWEAVLRRNVAHYSRLSPAEQARLRDLTRILVDEKGWEGCGGLSITDEIKLTIAAQASLLLIGLPEHDYFSRVPSVIVYPTNFRTPNPEDDWEDDDLSDRVLDGQSVTRGPVILSWDHVLAEGRDPDCGQNVVVHEFAHQLDDLDGLLNGTPPLTDPADSARWQKVMQAALDTHRAQLDAGGDVFFTEEAAESEVEFFADAAETFYCVPHDLKAAFPEVYELFASYFQVDPVKWFPSPPGTA